MSLYANPRDAQPDRFNSGLAGAIGLHIAIAAGLIALAYFNPFKNQRWGENAAQAGSIQASMVSAIPLPQKVPPVKDNVLAPDDVNPAPTPPPKAATVPPPLPTDVLIKAKTPPKTKLAPTPTPAPPRHPQPTPPTPKATTGEAATQIPESVNQVQNGTSSLTVQNKTFGDRYAYYLEIVGRKVSQNWFTQEADPGSSIGRRVTVIFDIQRDGSPTNVRVLTPSGSASLDASALHALQRIDGFGPLPAGNQITVEDTFDYHR
jgi:protein TonB